MRKLSGIFESIRWSLHWGPSTEPFHLAVIEAHEALQSAHDELQAAHEVLREDFDKLKTKFYDMFPARSTEPPKYISETDQQSKPTSVDLLNAAVRAMSAPVPDDAASLSEAFVESPKQAEDAAHSMPEEQIEHQDAAASEPNPAESPKDAEPLLSATPDAASAGSLTVPANDHV